jgi:membrane associated rhomboid family serine protease
MAIPALPVVDETEEEITTAGGDVNITENPLYRQVSAPENGAITPTNYTSRSRSNWRSLSSNASKTVKKKAAKVFKVNEDPEKQLLWDERRERMIARTCGKVLKESPKSRGEDVTDSFHVNSECEGIYCRKPAYRVALEGVRGSIKKKRSSPVRPVVLRCSQKGDDVRQMGVDPTIEPLTKFVDDTDGSLPEYLTPDQLQGIDPDLFEDHRPFFTYYIATAQILIMLIALIAYGVGPIGFTKKIHSEKVLVSSLSLQQVDFHEPQNLWIGPPAAALIHLGAKFTPCMRFDKHVIDTIQKDRDEEKESGCCIRNDESGCVQTTKDRCSDILSTWKKWTPEKPGPKFRYQLNHNGDFVVKNRTSGSVCGQDPRFCNSPASRPPYEWPDDISRWPICLEPQRPRLSDEHMSCEIIARPCCIGIYGECRITTQEYCQFVEGYFHEEATLCSQVSCMDDVCGLVPFFNDEVPDQWYRVISSLFLHAGIIHLIFSLLFYYFFMMNIEKMVGPLRTAAIYFSSGIAGNLASAAFVPYRAEVGPAGSILGIMGCLIVVIVYTRDLFVSTEAFHHELIKKVSITVLFLFAGLVLPWIDNYAHIAGLFVGAGVSLICVPYMNITREEYSARSKKIIISTGIAFLLFATILLSLILYVFPIYECDWCKYVNCLFALFTDDLCPDQDIKITRVDIL